MEKLLFCPHCGRFRDLTLTPPSTVTCKCGHSTPLSQISDSISSLTQTLPLERSALLLSLYGRQKAASKSDAEIEEPCPRCNYPRLSFTTAQLRGVDEGQTIFYRCLREGCGHRFTVNS